MKQNALTVIVPIKPEKVDVLRAMLNTIGQNIDKSPQIDFRKSVSTHFARFVILDPSADTPSLRGRAPRLYFSSNYDGSPENYIAELVHTNGANMEPLWAACEGYPPGAAQDVQRFSRYLKEFSYEPEAFYVGAPGAGVGDIRMSEEVRKTIDRLLDSAQAGNWMSEIYKSFSGRLEPFAQNKAVSSVNESGLPKTLFRTFAGALEWLVGVRPRPGRFENRLMWEKPHQEAVKEDFIRQNQLTVIFPIKQRFLPQTLLRLVFATIARMAAGTYGSLAGLFTIHFARWVIIDDGENLLFESNYDGTWESYIDDFVDFASLGMNAIWANCVGFPKAGCKDIESFKAYIRESQIPAQVFYSAYPGITMKNKVTDLQITSSVGQFLGQKDIRQFMAGNYRTESFNKLPPLFQEVPAAPVKGV